MIGQKIYFFPFSPHTTWKNHPQSLSHRIPNWLFSTEIGEKLGKIELETVLVSLSAAVASLRKLWRNVCQQRQQRQPSKPVFFAAAAPKPMDLGAAIPGQRFPLATLEKVHSNRRPRRHLPAKKLSRIGRNSKRIFCMAKSGRFVNLFWIFCQSRILLNLLKSIFMMTKILEFWNCSPRKQNRIVFLLHFEAFTFALCGFTGQVSWSMVKEWTGLNFYSQTSHIAKKDSRRWSILRISF